MNKPLTIHVLSFSYHRNGIPPDPTGHGGGFVFDCRFLPNPGREERYADLDGRDDEVRRYMLDKKEVEAFWVHVRGIVDEAVLSYAARGYTDLTVAFGCTGGQHRSVFFAERLFAHLSKGDHMCGLDHLARGESGS